MAAILGVLIAVCAGAFYMLLRLNSAAGAARDLANAAGDMHGLYRGWKWRRKLSTDLLGEVDDPRIAAAVMMVSLAQADGAITEREQNDITLQLTDVLGATSQQAKDIFAHARWLARDVQAPADCFRRLTPVIQKHCDAAEMGELIEMLETVAASGATLGASEREAIAQLKRTLLAR